MKNITFTLVSIALVLTLSAQPPQSFKYQAVARDGGGNILANQSISLRVGILQDSITGTLVYSETHSVTTNDFGLVNLEIGSGVIVSGIFANINWRSGMYFLQTEMDAAGGTEYQLIGVSQLISVPYALDSQHAHSLTLTDENGNTYEVLIDSLGNLTATMINEWQTCGDEFTDIRNGKRYGTVLIGSQCWMADNLNIGTRINGNQNQTLTTPEVIQKYCYNDIEDSCNTYGGLYQWNEMMQYITVEGTQGICPEGWHIPTNLECNILEGFVDSQSYIGDPLWNNPGWRGFDAGKNLKTTNGWYSSGNGSNLFGFSFLPGGNRGTDGLFHTCTENGRFWTSTQENSNNKWSREFNYDNDGISKWNYSRNYGLSVRCLKDYTNQPPSAPSDPVPTHGASNVSIDQTLSWTCSDPDGNYLFYSVYFGDNPTPPYVQAGLTTAAYDPGTLNYNTTYYWQITAFDSYCDSAVNDIWNFDTEPAPWECSNVLVDERDAQTYNTVQIGEQCWMKQNLNIGTMIPGTNYMTNNSIIEKYCFDNNAANCSTYGGLYQWNEMMQYTTQQGSNGICPSGWHLPTDAEWTTLTTFLGGESVAGGKMKSTGTIEAGTGLWHSPNSGATNSSGFTALPGGYRYYDSSFYFLGYNAIFWSSTEFGTSNAWYRMLSYSINGVSNTNGNKSGGYSVRCLKD